MNQEILQDFLISQEISLKTMLVHLDKSAVDTKFMVIFQEHLSNIKNTAEEAINNSLVEHSSPYSKSSNSSPPSFANMPGSTPTRSRPVSAPLSLSNYDLPTPVTGPNLPAAAGHFVDASPPSKPSSRIRGPRVVVPVRNRGSRVIILAFRLALRLEKGFIVKARYKNEGGKGKEKK